MGWLGRKIDTLVGAILVAIAGMALSQFQAFVHQYLQRLGGHLDEARRNFRAVLEGELAPALDEAARQSMLEAARARVADIESAYEAIKGADILARPFVFLGHLEPNIAMRVFEDFKPAIPVDATSLIYTGTGMILALVVYELLKLPFGRILRGHAAVGRR